jgi:hypothetical protein
MCAASCSRLEVPFTNQQKKQPLKKAQRTMAHGGNGPLITSLFQSIFRGVYCRLKDIMPDEGLVWFPRVLEN